MLDPDPYQYHMNTDPQPWKKGEKHALKIRKNYIYMWKIWGKLENNEGIKYGKESKANLEERQKVNEGRAEEEDHASKERKIKIAFCFL